MTMFTAGDSEKVVKKTDLAADIWTDPLGNPLAFQNGDYVRIDTSGHPQRAYTLPFLEGYIRGYDLHVVEVGGITTCSAAYELFKMGHSPLQWVREKYLSKAPELLPHQCIPPFPCGICGG
jgi:hypothetical protein